MKLHVEVTLLAPATAIVKKRKRTLRGALWSVYEGKEVRCMGRVDDDPKGIIATSAGRMFAASLHLAHGKLIDANSIEANIGDGTPKPKAAKKADADATAEAPAKPAKAKKGKAAKAAEPNGEAPAAEPTEAAPAEANGEVAAKEAKAPKAKAAKEPKPKASKKAKKVAEATAE